MSETWWVATWEWYVLQLFSQRIAGGLARTPDTLIRGWPHYLLNQLPSCSKYVVFLGVHTVRVPEDERDLLGFDSDGPDGSAAQNEPAGDHRFHQSLSARVRRRQRQHRTRPAPALHPQCRSGGNKLYPFYTMNQNVEHRCGCILKYHNRVYFLRFELTVVCFLYLRSCACTTAWTRSTWTKWWNMLKGFSRRTVRSQETNGVSSSSAGIRLAHLLP